MTGLSLSYIAILSSYGSDVTKFLKVYQPGSAVGRACFASFPPLDEDAVIMLSAIKPEFIPSLCKQAKKIGITEAVAEGYAVVAMIQFKWNSI